MITYNHSFIHSFIRTCIHAAMHSCVLFFLISTDSFSQTLLDTFDLPAGRQDSTAGWNIFKSDGVEAEVLIAEGYKNKAIRFDYNFTKGTGYGGIQKIIPLDLPENFQFTFYVKAESPANNFEIKFLDSTGHKVWWVNNRNYDFPTEWTKIKIKKRHINFAWGPTEDKSLKRIDRIEFTIASYVGGKGTVYIDELKFEELPPEDNSPIVSVVSASSELSKNYSVKKINDNNHETEWKSSNDENQSLILDLQRRRELGGIVIDWSEQYSAKDFNIYLTQNNKDWQKVYSVKDSRGYKSHIRLVEEDASKIKIDLLKSSRGKGYGIKEISVKNVDYSADINKFFINIAKDNPRGYYPRYFNEEGTFWTVVGVNNDVKEALINEDGMVEVDKKSFSIEPFLFVDNSLVTWNDVKKKQSLEENYLPVPSVSWNYNDLILETKIFPYGEANRNSILYLRYTLTNNSPKMKKGNLFLAIRPFQVNPYYQWLNITGGASEVFSLKYEKDKILVNNDKVIIPITKENYFGAAKFDEGDITTFLSKNIIPQAKSVFDERDLASGCLKYSFELDKGVKKIVYLAVPLHKYEMERLPIPVGRGSLEDLTNELIPFIKSFWMLKLNRINFSLPKSADKIINTWKSNLAYILINRDKTGIQPGSRSYERSWIRDGALTSSALLKSGIVDEVRDFIDWYTSHQYENGKVPCVVDTRGPDPVPENDSHGEMIYLIKEYFNFTKDTAFLRSKNESVLRTVSYMEELIAQRSTGKYKQDTMKAYYGIMPESISHEGYSAKPMHSYWDNFFTMKGLKDAAEIQKILGEKESYERVKKARDDFQKNLFNSLDLAIKMRNIDYIPGCVELGDFDATSTTIAISPCNELHNLPQPYAQNTFDKYYEFFKKRRDNQIEWTGYTPYENRLIGSFVFLDQPERAHELIDFFLDDQRPSGWNHWAEVVWKDERHPGFIGDMPHTWVGSDFINAVRSIFVYENEYDSSLVVGAALYKDWIDAPDGMSVENLPTYYGELSYSIKKMEAKTLQGYNEKNNMQPPKVNAGYVLKLYGSIELPEGGIVLKNFNGSEFPQKVFINEKETKYFSENKIVIKEFPSKVEILY